MTDSVLDFDGKYEDGSNEASTVPSERLDYFGLSLSGKIYWFDVEDNPTNTVHIGKLPLGLNEVLNTLQFAAKVHELLMIGSLSAIVLHFVRKFLVGVKGLPFGLLTAGYSVGSTEYIFSKAFWGSGFNRVFWTLSILLIFCTLLANLLGPSSAIALIPNLDWWHVDDPFSSLQLPVGFKYNRTQQWPLELSVSDIILPLEPAVLDSPDACMITEFLDLRYCPASGYNELIAWSKGFANENVNPEVTMIDYTTNAKRVVASSLTKRSEEGKTSVAFSTSVAHSITMVMSSFWHFAKAREFAINKMVRSKLGIYKEQDVLQPLVQVQCEPRIIPQFAYFRPSLSSQNNVNSSEINTFSSDGDSQQRSWPFPEGLQTYTYNISEDIAETTAYGLAIDFAWVNISSPENSSGSIAAVVITPFVGCDPQRINCSQYAFAHLCTTDARWVGSNPFLDPGQASVVQHNLTQPLLFQKSRTASTDAKKYGISPSIRISSSWASFLNPPLSYPDPRTVDAVFTTGALQWLLGTFVQPVPFLSNKSDSNSNITYMYDFSPAFDLAGNKTVLETVESVGIAASETIGTILSIAVTDGLARVGSAHDYFIGIDTGAGNKTAVNLGHFIGEQLYQGAQSNLTAEEWTEIFLCELRLTVDRYGYGYGLQTVTVRYAISIILIHALLTVMFLMYVTYSFYFQGAWTSKAWGNMAELAAMLINSDKTENLQNTCAGIEEL